MDVLRQHEIAEANHRILNPLTDEKLMLVGEICRLQPDQRHLDLACGKGEMLCRFASRFGTSGRGIDLSKAFVAAARARAEELGVAHRVRFDVADASEDVADASEIVKPASYDVVSCLGASWIGGGIGGTINLMRGSLRRDGLLLIGEPYWQEDPPGEALAAFGFGADDFTSLTGTFDRFDAARLELVEMVLADGDSWDRYVAAQWWTVNEWLRVNPDDPDAPPMRRYLEHSRRSHLSYGRRYLGWGVFVLADRSADGRCA